ncbi:hypothetical protein KM043_017569 [Ampulex compressa]|nr:hypothetical protein KM043_017569 [Ampulex compressa]
MASSLSAYWVKFFKGAGFPQDVATKHAVVFSNNRIKPDMLPDLDKPSLKEMGITLMGDMIAILRYAKKVVEETTCEKFLVDSEDTTTVAKPITKTMVKKIIAKTPNKTVIAAKTKTDSVITKKIIKVPSTSLVKTIADKKPVSTSNSTVIEFTNQVKQITPKRKLEEIDCDNADEWSILKKKLKLPPDEKEDKVNYTVVLPKTTGLRNQQNLKKSIDQKRTVFDRLGDSSVTSTTNLAETSGFNITGLGKDTYKRPASVFNRLGDKDAKINSLPQTGILKNGANSTNSGILKNQACSAKTSIITTKKIMPKLAGTMRADQEANIKTGSNSIKQLMKTTKKIIFNNTIPSNMKLIKSDITSGKLASERLATIPAKARLGLVGRNSVKQVTFNKITMVNHLRKSDVFSRLGI